MFNAIRKYPFAAFVVLAYAFSWWSWPLYALGISPGVIVGFGPFVAAVVVLAIADGRSAVMGLLGRMVRWRVAVRWYVVALGLPFIITGLAAALNVWLGAPAPSAQQLAQWPSLLPSFIMFLLIPIFGAWEEPGWRGYALPYLAGRRSQLAAALLLAVVWGGWHLPLFLAGATPWADLLFILGITFFFSWVYFRAGRSVLIVMIFHAMNNTVGTFFPSLFSAEYVDQLALLQGLVCLAAALLLLATTWRFWTGQPEAPTLQPKRA